MKQQFTLEQFQKLCLNEREFHKFYLKDDGTIGISWEDIDTVQGVTYTTTNYLYIVFDFWENWISYRYDRNNNLYRTSSLGIWQVPTTIEILQDLIYL
jgi:hypothetical protein